MRGGVGKDIFVGLINCLSFSACSYELQVMTLQMINFQFALKEFCFSVKFSGFQSYVQLRTTTDVFGICFEAVQCVIQADSAYVSVGAVQWTLAYEPYLFISTMVYFKNESTMPVDKALEYFCKQVSTEPTDGADRRGLYQSGRVGFWRQQPGPQGATCLVGHIQGQRQNQDFRRSNSVSSVYSAFPYIPYDTVPACIKAATAAPAGKQCCSKVFQIVIYL